MKNLNYSLFIIIKFSHENSRTNGFTSELQQPWKKLIKTYQNKNDTSQNIKDLMTQCEH